MIRFRRPLSRIHNVLVLYLAIFVSVCSAAIAQNEVKGIGDVVYGHKSGMALTMDVLKPEKPSGIGVLWMSSGGWASGGEPLSNIPFYKPYTDRGQTVFLVRHGSQPKFTIEEVVADIHRAVRFVRVHAKEYGVDPDRLGISGASSGGHLSATIGTMGKPGDPSAKDPLERVSSRVQAVACFYPPLDLVDYGKTGQTFLDFPAVKPFVHVFVLQDKPKEEQLKKLREFSPFYAASKDTPPTLIIQGDKDVLVPNEQADRFIDKLKALGVPCEEVKRPGMGHGWPGLDKDIDILAAWFDKYLAAKPTQ